jgi:hypothetical protein
MSSAGAKYSLKSEPESSSSVSNACVRVGSFTEASTRTALANCSETSWVEGVTAIPQSAKAEMEAGLSEEERRMRREAEARRRRALPRSARRERWTDARYVEVAAMYVERVLSGSPRPVDDVARELHYSPARIRQALKHARDEGWLTSTTRRMPGGQLTNEALAILNRETT